VKAGGSPLFVYGVGAVRVDAFYMKWNNCPKVSNLTVGHHQFIPFTLHHEQGQPPLFMGTAPQFGDTLHQLYFSHFYTDWQQHTGDTL